MNYKIISIFLIISLLSFFGSKNNDSSQIKLNTIVIGYIFAITTISLTITNILFKTIQTLNIGETISILYPDSVNYYSVLLFTLLFPLLTFCFFGLRKNYLLKYGIYLSETSKIKLEQKILQLYEVRKKNDHVFTSEDEIKRFCRGCKNPVGKFSRLYCRECYIFSKKIILVNKKIILIIIIIIIIIIFYIRVE